MVEVVGRAHAQEVGLQAGVDVYPTRDDEVTVSVDDLHPSRHDEVFPNLPENRGQTRPMKKANEEEKRTSKHLFTPMKACVPQRVFLPTH